MEDNEVKRIEKRLNFGDLPPRVIIHDIISFHFLVIRKSFILSEGEFVLFGYFKRDRARNVWFVFSSLKLKFFLRRLQKYALCLDIKKIYFLFVIYFGVDDREIFDQLSKNSNKMFSLRCFRIFSHDSSIFENSSLKVWKFPYIKTFSSTIKSPLRNGSPSIYAISFPKSLEKLRFSFKEEGNNIFGKGFLFKEVENGFPNLKKLVLSNAIFAHKSTLFLPKLEHLEFSYVKNIEVVPGTLMRHFRIWGIVSSELVRCLIKKSQNLQSLNIFQPSRNFEEIVPLKLFYDESCNHLANLTFLFYLVKDLRFRFPESDVLSFLELKNQVKTLNIFQSNFEFDVFSQREWKSLRSLFVTLHQTVESTSDHIWPVSLKLRRLKLRRSKRAYELFTKNQWPLLEKLAFKHINKPGVGIGWNRLPNLVELTIERSTGFSNVFFVEHDEWTRLRFLQLLHCGPSLTGENWNEVIFRNLEHLELNNCRGFEDKFFQENQFLNLKHLYIVGSESLSGYKWKKMSSLECLEVKVCGNFEKENLENFPMFLNFYRE